MIKTIFIPHRRSKIFHTPTMLYTFRNTCAFISSIKSRVKTNYYYHLTWLDFCSANHRCRCRCNMDILERSGMTLTKSELLIFLIKCYAHPQTHMKPMKVISYKKREEQMFALVLRGGQMIEMKKENLFDISYNYTPKDFFSTTVHGDAASFCDAISD